MGVGSSSESATHKFYKKYTGGAGVFGGLEDVVGYEGGAMSAAKKDLIRDIAKILNEDLNLKGRGKKITSLKDQPIEDIIDALKQIIPDGKRRVFSSKSEVQVKKCKELSKAINKVFPGSVTGKSADEICKQVSEYMNSLVRGIGDEVAVAQKDINRVLKNLRETGQFIESNYKRIVEVLDASDDPQAKAEAGRVAKFHQELLDEHNRQMNLLQTMLGDIVQPTDEELSRILQESDEYISFVRSIGKPGTAEFAERMSYVLQGMRTTAEAAKLVDKALKDVGISYAKYKTTAEFGELKELLNSTILNISDMDEVAVRKYLRGVEVLEQYQYLHDDIISELGKTGSDEADVSVSGGLKLDKRVKARKHTRKALIKAFNARLHDLIKQILVSADGISKGVRARQVPLGDDLRKFIKSLNVLPSLHQRPVYFSITGYYADVKSKQQRESFINMLEHVITRAKPLTKSKGGSHFKDIIKTMEQIIDLIETYVDKFAQGFGPMESWEKYKKKMTGGDMHDDDNMPVDADVDQSDFVQGDMDELVEGGEVDLVKVTTLANTLDQAIAEISFFYHSTEILENLKGFSQEHKAYSEDYYKILADAIAAELDTIQKFENAEYKKFEEVDKETDDDCGDEADVKDGLYYRALIGKRQNESDFINRAASLTEDDLKDRKKELKKIKKYLDELLDSKRDLMRCAEAIDTYLMEFTNALASNPDDLQDILSILNSTEIIAQWFSEESGNSLCKVFECFPGYKIQTDTGAGKGDLERFGDNILRMNPDGEKAYNVNYYSSLGNKEFIDHYYVEVSKACGLGIYDDLKVLSEDPKFDVEDYHDFAAYQGQAGFVMGDDYAVRVRSVGLPGNPFLTSPIARPKFKGKTVLDALENAKDALKIGVVKNLISAFITIGGEFGGSRLIKKTNMSPKQIYSTLCNYIACSAFGFGFKGCKNGIFAYSNVPYNLDVDGLRIPSDEGPGLSDKVDVRSAETFSNIRDLGGNTLILGKFNRFLTRYDSFDEAMMRGAGRLSTGKKDYDHDPIVDYPKGMQTMSEEERELGSLHVGAGNKMDFIKDPFAETDEIFVMIIKSITAKILTAVGTYNMLNRPVDQNALGFFSGLRLTIGGGSQPKVIPEAIDLYIRLPLLAEFYREIFSFDDMKGSYRQEYGRRGDIDYNISMVPEMDGTFSGLIYVIFDRARHVKEGTYSSSEISALVEEVNKIYMTFKSSSNPIKDTINEFIAEVNRRYGIIKKKERDAYLKERQRSRSFAEHQDPSQITDFDLDAIDEDDDYRRPAPSDAYRQTHKESSSSKRKHKHQRDRTHRQDIQILRKRIDDLFDEAANALMEDVDDQSSTSQMKRLRVYTFENLINARRLELAAEKDPQKQFDIVTSSINSLSSFAVNTLERSYILFHETVVTGLNTLFALKQQLYGFFKSIAEMDLAIEAFKQTLDNVADVDRTHLEKYLVNAAYAKGHIEMGRTVYDGITNDYVLNAAQIVNDAVVAGDAGAEVKQRQILEAYGLNKYVMMLRLFESLFVYNDLGDLTRVSIDTNPKGEISIVVDSGDLKDKIYAVFNKIKKQLDTFRGILPESVIDKYEKYEGKDSSSLYSLEKHLINELVEGRWGENRWDDTKFDKDDKLKEDNLDKVTPKIVKILEFLKSKVSMFDPVAFAAVGDWAAIDALVPLAAEQPDYSPVIAKLLLRGIEEQAMHADGAVLTIKNIGSWDTYVEGTNNLGVLTGIDKVRFGAGLRSAQDKTGLGVKKFEDGNINSELMFIRES